MSHLPISKKAYHCLCQILTISTIAFTACSNNTEKITLASPPPKTTKTTNNSLEYQVIDELKKPQFTIRSQQIFKNSTLPKYEVNFEPNDLLIVLKNTKKYFQEEANNDPDIQRQGILGDQGVTIIDVMKTLDFMIAILQEDINNQQPIRLQDPEFLNKNFRAINWKAFNPKATRQKNIRLTKYAVFTHPGSRTPTEKFNIALYSLKPEAVAEKINLKYTKQDVLNNIYEPGGKEFGKVEPLVYLDREGLEASLMEGTVKVIFPDGTSAFYNVDRSNGIPYVKGLDRTQQKRYWYFKPVDEIKGYGHNIDKKISIKPGVTFAGDILNIGLGKIVALEYFQAGKPQLKLGIIADTGGAFLPNLYQLDFLSGIFATNQDYQKYVKTLPEYAKAYILIKK